MDGAMEWMERWNGWSDGMDDGAMEWMMDVDDGAMERAEASTM